MATNSEATVHKCTTCGKCFQKKGNFKKHIRDHSHECSFTCTTCQKSFKNRSDLSRHMVMHSEETPFKCSSCGRQFKRKRNLISHMRIHTNAKSFHDSSHLSRHIAPYSELASYECNICDASFNYKCSLTRHSRVCVEKAPESAEKASEPTINKNTFRGIGFKLKTDLIKNISIYTDKSPHPCKECCRSFKQSCHLTTHMRTHPKSTPYRCSTCQKFFSSRIDLTIHLKSHLDETASTCSVSNVDDFGSECDGDVSIAVSSRAEGEGFSISGSVGNNSKHTYLHDSEAPYVIHVKKEED